VTPTKVLSRAFEQPWIWAYLGAFTVWLATIAFTRGTGGGQILTAAFTFAVFFVIVGIGQMFVITLGPGNVDLSIPATITLAGAVSTKLMDSHDSMILIGALAALACGLGVGIFNYGLIRLLRIPPIIATLSAAFIVQSLAIAYGRGLRIKPPDALAAFTTARIGGVPVLALCVIALAALMSVVLHRTVYGRSVIAIGQSQRHLVAVPIIDRSLTSEAPFLSYPVATPARDCAARGGASPGRPIYAAGGAACPRRRASPPVGSTWFAPVA
jgi:ribose transport system permease protein